MGRVPGYICPVCERDVEQAAGCLDEPIELRGQTYRPLPFQGPEERCPGCNVLRGNVHHLDCERELCPRCKEPLNGCLCRMSEAEAAEVERLRGG